jgi:hypothetical protein
MKSGLPSEKTREGNAEKQLMSQQKLIETAISEKCADYQACYAIQRNILVYLNSLQEATHLKLQRHPSSLVHQPYWDITDLHVAEENQNFTFVKLI